MVSFKLVGVLLAATCLLTTSQAASTKKPAAQERVAALYVKDNSNGELRFLGGGISSNAQLNQLITQKQDMLEQLRPTTSTGTANWGTTTGVTGTGSVTGTGTGTGAASVITGLGGSGVTPIVINAGGAGSSSTASSSGSNNFIPPSPIGDLLPQIIAQAALTRGRPGSGNRRRVVNQRRRNRRPVKRGNRNKNKPQVYVVRPRN